uniref:Uncharacterized protein n=1 Tax=Oryza sativa subsp. japonica TaxID=39947 RepID=Q6EPM7_ORYSJ|nr:hypothetical protein [Oryza sativa Japonica Group]
MPTSSRPLHRHCLVSWGGGEKPTSLDRLPLPSEQQPVVHHHGLRREPGPCCSRLPLRRYLDSSH